MSKPSAPPPPDYKGAAIEQGQANLEAARAQAKLSNPNVLSPMGAQTVTYGGGPPTFNQGAYDTAMDAYNRAMSEYDAAPAPSLGWIQGPGGYPVRSNTVQAPRPAPPVAPDPNQFYMQQGDPDVPTLTQKFAPEQQEIFDKTTQMKGLLGDVGIQGAESLKGVVGTPVDYSDAPPINGSQATRDAVMQAMMARVDEDTANARGRANSNLIARGITPGTKAYDDAMFAIDRGYNDARQRAILAAGVEAERDFGMDLQNRRNYIAELLSQRQIPLNEASALLSGSQVANPFAVPSFAGSQQVMPAPLYGATTAAGNYATDLYNADVGNYNAMMGGLFGLGSAALLGPVGLGLYGVGRAAAR